MLFEEIVAKVELIIDRVFSGIFFIVFFTHRLQNVGLLGFSSIRSCLSLLGFLIFKT